MKGIFQSWRGYVNYTKYKSRELKKDPIKDATVKIVLVKVSDKKKWLRNPLKNNEIHWRKDEIDRGIHRQTMESSNI